MATGLFLFLGYDLPLESGLTGNTPITFTAPAAAEKEGAIGSLGELPPLSNQQKCLTYTCLSECRDLTPSRDLTSPRGCYQQREQCGLLSCVGPSQGTWSVGCHPSPQPGSSGVFAFLLATVPHLMAHHLIALSIIFPICRMGTVILGSQGVGSINECLEAG